MNTAYAVKKNLKVGARLRGRTPRDSRRVVKVVEQLPASGRFLVENVTTGRQTELSAGTIAKNWRVVEEPIQPETVGKRKRRTANPHLTTRESELLRIIKAKFSDFNQRQQHFYIGGGMSTSHIVLKVLEDVEQIHAFWPKEHIRRGTLGTISYVLAADVFKKVQDRIRDTLKSLEEKGHLEKIGNTDERRWRPTYA